MYPNILGSPCHYILLIPSPLNSFLSAYSLNGETTRNSYNHIFSSCVCITLASLCQL